MKTIEIEGCEKCPVYHEGDDGWDWCGLDSKTFWSSREKPKETFCSLPIYLEKVEGG